jgi:tetratricopeptide (TPR) repeat protein
MIDAEDEALIMDFGIARSTGQPVAGPMPGNTTIVGDLRRVASTPDATVLGAVIGTVEYMAPEQAKGQPVDQRADVYAFGLIMYDMLTGRPRAQHMGSAVGELQARMVQAPPPAKSFVPDIPAALDAVVSRCLEPDAAKRFQTSQELAEALHGLDDNGQPIRIAKVVGLRLFAAVVAIGLLLLAGTWWFARGPAVPVQHDPVSVLIADFQNSSNDPTFDRTLEPILKISLEGAGFISAFDRSGVTNLGVKAPEKLDEAAARGIAIKQGLPVVVAGSIERQGAGYGVSLKAMQAVTGEVITTVSDRAASKDKVLAVATNLATAIREALGDRPKDSESAIFVKDTLSTSLDVVRHYAAGTEALSRGKFDDALRSFTESTNLDKEFGMGYQGMALASRNLGRQADAERYINEALKHLDRMTERERYRARGFFYRITLDWGKCVQEYGALISKYSADVAAHNQRALCSTHLRQMNMARDEMRQLVEIVPKGAIFRINLGIYASYVGDFQMGEQEARKALEFGSPWGWQALALAQTGLGQLTQAAESYRHLGEAPEAGPSYAASGLGDLATYEGRYEEAVKILQSAAAADLASKDTDRAAARFAALAYAQLSRKQHAAAVAAAEKALENSKSAQIRFLAARIMVESGQTAKALPIAESLVAELQAEPQAYGKIIQGEAALKKGDTRPAIKLFTEANTLLDTWMGRFDLGRAYLAEGMFIQADSEFDRCISRRGEALSLFLDEEPTYAYFPAVYYYQGRVREGMKSAGYAESYRNYLSIREKAGEDPLLSEIRRRLGS